MRFRAATRTLGAIAALLSACGSSSTPADAGTDAGTIDAGSDGDAGPDGGGGGVDAAADDAGPPDAGPGAGPLCGRACPTAMRLGSTTVQPLAIPPMFNVDVADPLTIGGVSFFAFHGSDCCADPSMSEFAGGIIRMSDTSVSDAVVFTLEPDDGAFPFLTGAFAHRGRPAVVHPNSHWTEAAVTSATTLALEESLDLTALGLGDTPLASPSIVELDGGGYLLLQGTQMRLTRLDADLTPMGATTDLMLDAAWGALIPTCDRIVAVFAEAGDLYSLVLDATGAPIAATPRLVANGVIAASAIEVHAVWDGVAITITGAMRVLELDESGALLTDTPTTGTPLASAGTDDAILVVEDASSMPGMSPRALRRERMTGRIIQNLGSVDVSRLPSDAAIGVHRGRLDVVTTSFDRRSRAGVTRVLCR